MVDDYLVWPALAGGMLIGLSAVLLYLCNGRIAGISGILAGALHGDEAERGWRIRFLLGLVGGGALVSVLGFPYALEFRSTPLVTILAGLLVGYGTRLGNGCTSGHGVCGMGRGSRRSLVAVLVFIGTGMFTATLVSLVWGLP